MISDLAAKGIMKKNKNTVFTKKLYFKFLKIKKNLIQNSF